MPVSLSTNPCGYLDDARRLWKERLCLEPVSKNMKGRLELLNRERQECEKPKCLTLKTDHLLRLEVESNEPCDSEIGKELDGRLAIRELVHALHDGTGLGRGPHTGQFVWVGNSIEVRGEMSGMTNVGTHREPVFDPCQKCHNPGVMEGRLCGRITRSKYPELIGCRVVAAYRLRFDPSEGFQDTQVEGTLEGVVVCTCEEGKCIDFTTFPEGVHSNAWDVNGCRFHVLDHSGAPTPNTEVTAMGGGVSGLNAGYLTRIALPAPATTVRITVINYSTPPTIIALDSGGLQVDSALVAAAGVPETIELNAAEINEVHVRSPQNETLILEFCVES
ncbi:MAG: hypothetical protein ACRBK7_29075 [Acidimicrobiales bacterium]